MLAVSCGNGLNGLGSEDKSARACHSGWLGLEAKTFPRGQGALASQKQGFSRAQLPKEPGQRGCASNPSLRIIFFLGEESQRL